MHNQADEAAIGSAHQVTLVKTWARKYPQRLVFDHYCTQWPTEFWSGGLGHRGTCHRKSVDEGNNPGKDYGNGIRHTVGRNGTVYIGSAACIFLDW